MLTSSDQQARWPALTLALLFLGYAAGKAAYAAEGRLGFPTGPDSSGADHERYANTVMPVAAAQWAAVATGLLAALLVLATVLRVGRRVPGPLMLTVLGLAAIPIGAGALIMVVDGFVGIGIGWRWWHGVVGAVVVCLLVGTLASYSRATRR